MSILSDIEIEQLCTNTNTPMISPYNNNLVRSEEGRKVISRFQTSYGYDVSLAEEFKIFSNINSVIIDPKNFDDKCLVDGKIIEESNGDKYVILPPNSYLLGRTIEYFDIPNDILVVAVGKSTYARAACIVNVTPIEPGFKGNIVIEISNGSNLPMKVYANEGIAQFLFFKGSKPCRRSYADGNRKYQGQTGIVLPKV